MMFLKQRSRQSIGVMVLLLFAAALRAQAPDPESIKIGCGDLLRVQFYDTPELEQHPRVEDTGSAPLIFLGEIPLAGMTVNQAAGRIAELMILGKFMSHPQVVVSIEQYATQGVTVSGEVGHPGTVMITTPRSVIDVLALAGGLSLLADRHVVIRHSGNAAAPTLYFVSNDPATQLANDLKIRPGDTILVSKVGVVYILGDVGRPGGYPLATNEGRESLLQAVALAGSANKTAVLSQVRLLHKSVAGYREEKIDLDKVQKGRVPDVVLSADDVIFIPFSYAKNFALNGTAVAASVVSAALYNF
jgi:polysaccharide export outer membrane protein